MRSVPEGPSSVGDDKPAERRRIILLHGPPASGKLTTARCLIDHVDAVILHNHLTFNLARTLFEIGDQRLLNLHRLLRLLMLEHALAPTPPGAQPVADIILTLVYAEPDSVANIREITHLADATDTLLLPFHLRCSRQTLLARVDTPGREAEGKLHSTERLQDLLSQKHYPPIPHPNTRIVDNDDRSAAETAAEIAHLLAAPVGA